MEVPVAQWSEHVLLGSEGSGFKPQPGMWSMVAWRTSSRELWQAAKLSGSGHDQDERRQDTKGGVHIQTAPPGTSKTISSSGYVKGVQIFKKLLVKFFPKKPKSTFWAWLMDTPPFWAWLMDTPPFVMAYGHSPLLLIVPALHQGSNLSCCFLWGNQPALERRSHLHTCWKIQTTNTLINWISNEEILTGLFYLGNH